MYSDGYTKEIKPNVCPDLNSEYLEINKLCLVANLSPPLPTPEKVTGHFKAFRICTAQRHVPRNSTLVYSLLD